MPLRWLLPDHRLEQQCRTAAPPHSRLPAGSHRRAVGAAGLGGGQPAAG